MLYRRVLITGANGLVGQELVAQLSRHPECDVLATGQDSDARLRDGSFGYVPLDVTSNDDMRRVFQDFSPNIVINSAAMTNVDQCETERDACWRVNVDAVESLTRLSLQFGAKLVHISTDFVFDGQDGPYQENDRPNPVNFYGRSKLAAENIVLSAGLLNWAIVRTVLVYGTGYDLGRSNIALWVIDRLSRGETIRVVEDQWRTPTYAPDLAAGIDRLIRYEKNGVYHLSGRDFLSVHDFAHRIADVFEFDAGLIQPANASNFSQTAVRPPCTGFIILKAETEFGYRPLSLDDGLRRLGARLGLLTAPSRTNVS